MKTFKFESYKGENMLICDYVIIILCISLIINMIAIYNLRKDNKILKEMYIDQIKQLQLYKYQK